MSADMDLRGPSDFLRAADAALYRAKGAGRDCVRIAEMPVKAQYKDAPEWKAS
jgi:hypothetical protein